MELEELIKKMENMEVPPIEIRNHKQRLRMALLDSECFKQKPSIFSFKRIVFLTSAVAVTMFFLSVAVINPRLMEASAMEIANNDPQIKKMISENGMFIKEIKVKDGKAFALLVSVERDLKSFSAEETGSVAEIDIPGNKVEKVNDISLLGDAVLEEERLKALTILGNDPQTKDLFSKADKDKVILKPVTSLKLDIEDNDDRVLLSFGRGEDKIMVALFEIGGSQYFATVNLTQEKIEKVQVENGEENNSSSLSDKISERIGDAEEKMEEARTLIQESGSEATASLLRDAEKHLESAKEAHSQEKYSEAFGQANAALSDINNAIKNAEKEKDNDSEENTENNTDKENGSDNADEITTSSKSNDKSENSKDINYKNKESLNDNKEKGEERNNKNKDKKD